MSEKSTPFGLIARGCKQSLKSAAGFSLLVNLLQLTVPLYMMQVLDRVIGSGSEATLAYLTLIAVAALAVSAFLDIIRAHLLNRAASWLDSRLGLEIFPHVALAIQRGKPEQAHGLEDLWRVRSFLASPGVLAIFDIPWMVIYIAILFFLAVPIGILALVGAGVLIGIAIYSEVSVRQVLSSAQKVTETSRDFLRAVQKSSDEVVAMGMMERVIEKWFGHNIQALGDQHASSEKAATNLALFRFARMVLQIAVLATGAVLVIDGQMTPGGIIGASIIMSRALSPVEQAITAWKQAISAYGAVGRLREILPDEAESKATLEYAGGPATLTLAGASYSFPGSTEPFLSDISIAASPGELLTIVGPSAAGKSTLLKLVAGIIRPSLGSVQLGDFPMSHYDRDTLGGAVGYVPQQSGLIPGTISENIARFGDLPAAAVVKAATRVGAHAFISALPEGYDTLVGGDSGHPLSGGQQQRISLARAICGNPGMLLMDEPNLNLDVEGERALYGILAEERGRGATIVVVSHQQRVMEMCDKIAVVTAGRITAFGTRNEVLKLLERLSKEGRQAARPDGGKSK